MNTENNYIETDLGNMILQLPTNILMQFHIRAAHTSAWQSWRQQSQESLLIRVIIQNIGR